MKMLSDSCAWIMLVVAAVLVVTASPSWAQTYPSHPIQLIVAYPQGGVGDIFARLISGKLASTLGQPVSVENRPGASGAIGAQSVARAAPDGYTLLVGQTPEVAISPTLVKDLGYEPNKDLQPIALGAITPLVLVVQNTAPYSTLNEMLEASRSLKRGLSFASAGPGTPSNFAGEMLRLFRPQSTLTHVPYDGAGPALDALMDGRVDFYFSPLPVAMPHVTSGKLRILALSSAKRSLAVPNVPAVTEETGIKGFDITNWVGIFAPRGTSKEIVVRLNRETNQILAQPNVRERLVNDGADIIPMSADQFASFVKSETSKYERLVAEQFCSRFLYGGCWRVPVE